MKLNRKIGNILSAMMVFILVSSVLTYVQPKVYAAQSTGKTASFASQGGELTVSLREVKENDWWYEYYLEVKNTTNQPICDWSLTVNVSDPSAYSQAFECNGTINGNSLVITGTGNKSVIAANSTLSDAGSFKLGFGKSVSFTDGKVAFNYGSSSSNPSQGSGVGAGNTYLNNYSCEYTLTGKTKDIPYNETPVGKHGALRVNGTNMVDEYNQNVILRGASTHGIHWGEMTPFVNKEAFQNLRDEWGVDMVRLVSYATQGGYTGGSKALLDETIQKGISYASDLGMYAIIDWHIHGESPYPTIDAAKEFFEKYSKMYAGKKNVIYEICNEPTGTPWPQIKQYAEQIVKIIRANDPNAIIIVGTNTWSQDVDEVATNGGRIDSNNIMYTIHFYSGTHGESLRDKVRRALAAGTPIFCTEFGICDASGNGNFNIAEANKWIDFFEANNISYSCWSLCNKDESASMISPASNKKSGWTNEDLGATGAWLINTYRKMAGDVVSPVPTATAIPVVTAMPTATVSPVITAIPTATASPVVTLVPTATVSPVVTPVATATVKPVVTPAPTATVKPVVTPAPVATATAKPVVTPVATATATATAKPVVTPVATATAKPVVTPVATATVKPVVTPVATATTKPVETPAPTATTKPVETAAPTSTPGAATSKPAISFKQKEYVVYATAKKQLTLKNIRFADIASIKSSNPSIASVSKQGIVTAKKAGKVKITVTAKDKRTTSCYVIVKTPSVKLNYSTLTLQVKQKTSVLKVAKKSKTDKVVSYKTSKSSIATVSKNGVITAKKTGTATITVTFKSGAKATCKVKVQKTPVKYKKLVFSKANIKLKKGKTVTIQPVKNPITANESVTYKSANNKIATVTKTGKIKGVKKGTTYITVKTKSGLSKKIKVVIK